MRLPTKKRIGDFLKPYVERDEYAFKIGDRVPIWIMHPTKYTSHKVPATITGRYQRTGLRDRIGPDGLMKKTPIRHYTVKFRDMDGKETEASHYFENLLKDWVRLEKAGKE